MPMPLRLLLRRRRLLRQLLRQLRRQSRRQLWRLHQPASRARRPTQRP